MTSRTRPSRASKAARYPPAVPPVAFARPGATSTKGAMPAASLSAQRVPDRLGILGPGTDPAARHRPEPGLGAARRRGYFRVGVLRLREA